VTVQIKHRKATRQIGQRRSNPYTIKNDKTARKEARTINK
jgi:hypothetical protein